MDVSPPDERGTHENSKGGPGVCSPGEILKSRVSKMPFPAFWGGDFVHGAGEERSLSHVIFLLILFVCCLTVGKTKLISGKQDDCPTFKYKLPDFLIFLTKPL